MSDEAPGRSKDVIIRRRELPSQDCAANPDAVRATQPDNVRDREQRDRLLEENRRLVQRCLELEGAYRKQMEKLQAANAVLAQGDVDLRILLENSAIGFALTDLNLRIASANATFADTLGYTQPELAGVNLTNFVYVGKLPEFNRLCSRHDRDPKADAVIELVSRSGSLVPCRIAISDWQDEHGAAKGHFILAFDAGPELLAAGRLREMEHSLAEANKSRKLFLEVIARELRTPASGVVGMSRMLMDAGLNDRQAELAGVIHSSANSLVRIVDDVVDVANLDAGKVKAEPIPVSPSDLAHGVVNLFTVRAEEKGLELRLQTAPNVPDPIMVDPHMLRRILAHLLDNAVKFTERGHVALVIDVLDDRLRFMVSDTGPGISADDGDIRYEPGAVPDNAGTRRFGGIGAGLSLCRRMVATLGGTLAYESESGRGSEFHFTIPIRRPRANRDTQRIEAPAEAMRLPSQAILLADGVPMSSRVIQAYLRFDGHRLSVTDNGVEATEKARTGKYDLIILDSALPKLDGMETLRLIREDEKVRGVPKTPVLVTVAKGQMRQPEYYTRAGADGVVAKPVTPIDLMTAVAKATGSKPISIARQKPSTQYQPGAGGGSIRRIDGNQLATLRQIMPDDQFFGILRFFMEDAMPEILALGKSLGQNSGVDRERLTLTTAKSRGLAGYLGFTSVAELLERLEKAARNRASLETLQKAAAELPQVAEDSLGELQRVIPEAFASISSRRFILSHREESCESPEKPSE